MGPLTPSQLRRFADDGYLVVPGLVDPARAEAAVAAIDQIVAAEPPPDGHTGHHFYWHRDQAALLDLYTATPVEAAARQLTAPDLSVPRDVQVALTFPPYRHRPGGGHLDGFAGIAAGQRPFSFTMLAGVMLSDQTHDDMGNLHVWPGSPRAIAEYARVHGVDELVEYVRTHEGVPPIDHSGQTQVHGSPGDVVFAHYLLAHNIGGNTSDVLRRTVYLRLSRPGHADVWPAPFSDPLREYDGVREHR